MVLVHIVCTLIRMLLREQSGLGPYCFYPDQITLKEEV